MKKIKSLALITLCIIALAGCGNSDISKNEENSENPNTKTSEIVNQDDATANSEDEYPYLSSIFDTTERKILLTYGTAKDSSVDEIFIAENGTLTAFEYDGTLGDVSQKTDDDIYSELQSQLSSNTAEYVKYDFKWVCQVKCVNFYFLSVAVKTTDFYI